MDKAEALKLYVLKLYAKGWTEGNADTILNACSLSYELHDPYQGVITREQFRRYLTWLKKESNYNLEDGVFMEIKGILQYNVGDKLIAACHWKTKKFSGVRLIIVGENGVEKEIMSINL